MYGLLHCFRTGQRAGGFISEPVQKGDWLTKDVLVPGPPPVTETPPAIQQGCCHDWYIYVVCGQSDNHLTSSFGQVSHWYQRLRNLGMLGAGVRVRRKSTPSPTKLNSQLFRQPLPTIYEGTNP